MKRRLSAPAVDNIEHILIWSRDNFGNNARDRHERLIARGLRAITAEKPLAASWPVDDVAPGVRLYHLRHVRHDPDGSSIGKARHVIAYHQAALDLLIVLRILHDAMDLPSQLRDDDSISR